MSCYYKNDTGDESHLEHIYVNADVRLDLDVELLSTNRYMQVKTAVMR
jgi:arginine/ornithine N-succinyltransferase beta subunit